MLTVLLQIENVVTMIDLVTNTYTVVIDDDSSNGMEHSSG
jgi:hypothetical protein